MLQFFYFKKKLTNVFLLWKIVGGSMKPSGVVYLYWIMQYSDLRTYCMFTGNIFPGS